MGSTCVQKGVLVYQPWYNQNLFPAKQVQTLLGGKIDSVISGSAPISADTVDFLKIALSCDVLEGT